MQLKILFWAMIGLSVLVAATYETGLLLMGPLAGRADVDFAATTCMELITICSIPGALRLIGLKPIVRDLKQRGMAALRLWGTIRILWLGLVMLANTILYYMLVNTTMGYMAIITLVAMAFIVPTRDRCEREITFEEDGKDEANSSNS